MVDPETGVLYTASIKSCGSPFLVPGSEADLQYENPTGTTVMAWASSGISAGPRGIQGLPILKPPYSRITAIDMNTGDHLWFIPNGDTPDNIANHRLLQGIDFPNTGNRTHATALLTKTLLIYAEGRGGRPLLYANDKATGERLGTVEIPAATNTALMTYMHDGKQYILLPVGGRGYSGSLVAMALP